MYHVQGDAVAQIQRAFELTEAPLSLLNSLASSFRFVSPAMAMVSGVTEGPRGGLEKIPVQHGRRSFMAGQNATSAKLLV